MATRLQNLKKMAALTVALLAVSFGVKGQTWYILGEYVWSPPNPQGTFQVYHYQGETTYIEGLEYHTLYSQLDRSLIGAYRNDGSEVYYRSWNSATSSYDDDKLLYDYNLEVGDYFNDADEQDHPMEVTEVSTITDLNGVTRKKISFEFVDDPSKTEYWIEGIGSNKGFIYMGQFDAIGQGEMYHLLCYHEGENLIFVNPDYNTCDIDEIEENIVKADISIYPNPAKDVIKILNDNSLHISYVEIFDLTGRTVLRTEKANDIDITSLSDGQYFVKIIGETTIVKKLFISK